MLFKGKDFLTGFTLGVGTGLVLREILPVIKEVASPISRAAIKAGVHIYEKGQEIIWGTVENVEDIVAEARYEYQERKLKLTPQKAGRSRKSKSPKESTSSTTQVKAG